MKRPHKIIREPGGVRLEVPGIDYKSLFELYDPETLPGLAHLLLWSQANPNDRELFVNDEEVQRVVALHPGAPLPLIVQERLQAIKEGRVQRPKGRPPTHTRGSVVRLLAAEACYEATFLELRSMDAAAFARWRAAWRIGDEFATPSAAAAEVTRRFLFRHMGSHRALLNLLSKREE